MKSLYLIIATDRIQKFECNIDINNQLRPDVFGFCAQ